MLSSAVSWLCAASLLLGLATPTPVSVSQQLAFQAEPTTTTTTLIEAYESSSFDDAQPLTPKNPLATTNALYGDLALPFSAPSLTHLLQGLVSSLSLLSVPLKHHHHLQEPIDCTKYTIGEVLNWTLHHTPKPSYHGKDAPPPPLHRLAWLVNLSHPIQEALYNPDADLTLFAPDDEALTPPSKKRHHLLQQVPSLNPFLAASSLDQASVHGESTHLFWDALEAIESKKQCHHMADAWYGSEGDDEPSDRKKKFFLHAVEMVLKYHISPGSKKIHEILDSSTLPTALPILPDPKAARFRLRVGPAFPHHSKPGEILLNFFTKLDVVKHRPIQTKNGVIYIVEKVPLLPPLSPLSELFLFPKPFSTLTSALQKTHLDQTLLPRWENKTIPLSVDPTEHLVPGSALNGDMHDVDERVQSVLSSLTGGHGGKLVKPSFTVFAPTNHAFRSLGPAANAFLFSPFGFHILRYILSFHIVPDIIWNTDHCERTKVSTSSAGAGGAEACTLDSHTYEQDEFTGPIGLHPFPPTPGKVNVTEFSLGTLLGSRKNESLPLTLVKFRHLGKGPIIRRVYVRPTGEKEHLSGPPDKHAIPVVVADGVAWGGALHMIPKLVHPPVPEGHGHRKDMQRAVELSILSPA